MFNVLCLLLWKEQRLYVFSAIQFSHAQAQIKLTLVLLSG